MRLCDPDLSELLNLTRVALYAIYWAMNDKTIEVHKTAAVSKTELIPQKKRPIPRKLNQGMIDALTGYVAKGNFANRACYLVGVDENTLISWKRQGEKDIEEGLETIYSELSISIKRAHAQAQAKLVEVMMNSATVDKNWLAAARTLESTDRENWWRTDKVVIDNSRTLNIARVEIAMPAGELIEGEVLKKIEE